LSYTLNLYHEEARGVVVGQDDNTALAYADDIHYIVHDDEECDRVFQAISSYCIESNDIKNPYSLG
jgi:hypothetical protein